jgi:hypothetical protein
VTNQFNMTRQCERPAENAGTILRGEVNDFRSEYHSSEPLCGLIEPPWQVKILCLIFGEPVDGRVSYSALISLRFNA